ncbi:3821_t:CDS:2 [Ambispora gerdemannii]|uniref:Xylulose kinase n=1 Tax=Ambispora gerdemannii TaxID=144530 RepID=A0A9N9CQ12_9GLOM|nr:3821_t:CDS:2 [Ambispora gerdemannii]
MENLFFGLDLSTQQLKLTVIDENFKVILEESVHFDKELSEYGTKNGVISNGNIVISPTLMWVAAVDRLFTKLQSVGFPFQHVKVISGAGQQHGSVYWRKKASNIFANLEPSQLLVTQLRNCFAIPDSPTWQDSSTTQECRQLEYTACGPEVLAKITGSKAYERFTGNQIAKIYCNNREAYDETERISLVSSFVATLLLGKYAPIDVSDGSGMNLLDIYTKEWDNRLLEACGSELRQKLGEPEKDGFKVIGKISEYFIKRYGFDYECMILPFMGDNPSSLLSLRLEQGDIVVSLGTSDTVLLLTDQANPTTESHTLCHPIDPNAYISMLCYKNGSLTRESIRDTYANKSWNKFNEILHSYPHPHENIIGFYFPIQEIIPFAHGIYRFINQEPVQEFDDDSKYNVRAILESQFMSMRIRTEKLISGKKWKRINAIGGASENTEILKVLADVFGVDVWRYSGRNSAGYGAALKARMATIGNFNSSSLMSDFFKIAEPRSENTLIYERMLNIYQQLELRILKT